MRRRALLLVAGLLATLVPVASLRAQGSDSVARRWPVERHGAFPLFGVRRSPEAGAAVSLGAGLNGLQGMEAWSGPIVAIEPGVRALRVSAGVAVLAPMAIHGLQFRTTMLRTWADGGLVAQRQWFVGPELRFSLMLPSIGVGRYWRVQGSAPGDASFWAMTYGLGF